MGCSIRGARRLCENLAGQALKHVSGRLRNSREAAQTRSEQWVVHHLPGLRPGYDFALPHFVSGGRASCPPARPIVAARIAPFRQDLRKPSMLLLPAQLSRCLSGLPCPPTIFCCKARASFRSGHCDRCCVHEFQGRSWTASWAGRVLLPLQFALSQGDFLICASGLRVCQPGTPS